MGAADKVAFVFSRPGKSKEEPKDDKKKSDYGKDDGEDSQESAPTREELGKNLADAIEARDGEAITEAVLKIVDLGADAE